MIFRKNIVNLIFLFALTFGHAQKEFQSRFSAEELAEAPVKLLPFPQNAEWGKGTAVFESIQIIAIPELEAIKFELSDVLDETGVEVKELAEKQLRFLREKEIPEEGYKLKIEPDGIEISASGEAGFFYALQSLRQLGLGAGKFQLVRITDSPAHGVRGFLLDVGRNFISLPTLKDLLDEMARYKLNVFQWHLTDYPAWRIESRVHPELTAAENHRETRDPGNFYTYEEIREVIEYAKDRQIKVIPEIDMPGHSKSFTTATGHKMESPEGKKILKAVLEEFFQEIPRELAPIIHIGSDEVEIEEPEVFMNEIISYVKSFDRDVMIWNPGLPADNSVIRQTWKPGNVEDQGYREIDSWNSYINNGEPMIHIPKLFFKPIGGHSGNKVLGGIIALWHDVNMEGEETLWEQHPLYPSLLTYAWTTWTADVQKADNYLTSVPPAGTPENEYFGVFEEYLMAHKQKYFSHRPFQYSPQAKTVWKLIGPFREKEVLTEIKDSYSENDSLLKWREATGNTVYIRDRFKQGGQYPEARPGETYFALTYVFSETARKVPFWIGFETPYRANRVYSGTPEKGEWDRNGGNIWINDQELPSPDWENPGWTPSRTSGWGSAADQEIPWRKEELYWTRDPVQVPLKKGWNKVLIKVPGQNDYQNWMFTFAPLDDEGIRFSTSKKQIGK